jgi:hypothetical protein
MVLHYIEIIGTGVLALAVMLVVNNFARRNFGGGL